MNKLGLIVALSILACTFSVGSTLGAEGPVAWWKFDTVEENTVLDSASGRRDAVEGNYKLLPGVVGSAMRFDSFTTVIDRAADQSPKLGDNFTVEAWVALGAYPWNWCPIVTQQRDEQAGYAFSVGSRGQIRLQAAVDGTWQSCASDDWVLPMRKWVYIVGTYDAGKGITLFANGKKVGTLEVKGKVAFAPDMKLRIGTNQRLTKPSNIHREQGTVASFWCFDGAIDELKIDPRAISAAEVAKNYADNMPSADPAIPHRLMPCGPKGPGRFGAVYCNLKYYEQWDALWRVGPDPDVVVRFDETPVRVVFWRGSRYSPAWVTDKDQWMADQSVEAWKGGKEDTDGCFEHMQDRLCRYSHVRIIESNDARTVVHWRYAPVSSKNHLWNVDKKTGRACWVDEYYTIYPDALGIRKVTWKKGTLGHPRQFQESLPFTNPDQYNNDVVEKDFCTVANMQGEKLTLRFVEKPAKKTDVPPDLTIQRYNFRSPYDPVIIYEPGNEMHYVADRDLAGLSRPGACNHWPVGQCPCDGRTSQAADRPTHFLGFPISYPPVHENEDRCWWNAIYGMTELSADELVPVARSWNFPPELQIDGKGFSSQGYDRGQRAFLLSRSADGGNSLKINLAADADHPLFNPAFVIAGWGPSGATLTLDGREVPRGKNLRIGHRYRLEGADLIVWLQHQATQPVHITLTAR